MFPNHHTASSSSRTPLGHRPLLSPINTTLLRTQDPDAWDGFADPRLHLPSAESNSSSPSVRRTSLTATVKSSIIKEHHIPLSPQSIAISERAAHPLRKSRSQDEISTHPKPLKIQSVRHWIASQDDAAQEGYPVDPDLFVHPAILSEKARLLAIRLAHRKDDGSKISWLINAHDSPDDLAKEARRILMTDHFFQQREQLLDDLCQQLEAKLAASQTPDALVSSHLFNNTIQALHDLVSQFKFRTAHFLHSISGGSALLGTAEEIELVHSALRRGHEDIIREAHGQITQIEGLYVLKQALGELEISSEQDMLKALLETFERVSQKTSNKGQHLRESMTSEEGVFGRISTETHLHLKMANEIGSIAHSRGEAPELLAISERDIIEMIRVNLPVDTEDEQGNSLLQIALSHQHYTKALELFNLGANLGHRNHSFEPIALNQIKISRKSIQMALDDYARDHSLWGKKNYHEIQALLSQTQNKTDDISMGQLMKILLNNPGKHPHHRNMKSLLAIHLGIDIQAPQDYGHGALLSHDKICQEIRAWCCQMIQLKLGASSTGFEQSNLLIQELVQLGLDRLDTPEGIALIDQLFSMNSMQEITIEVHNDQNLAYRLNQKFFSKIQTMTAGELEQRIGPKRLSIQSLNLDSHLTERAKAVLQLQPLGGAVVVQTDFRQNLDRALSAYRRDHRFTKFKSNYQATLTLIKSSSQELLLGDVLAIFHSNSGDWTDHAFKKQLAQALNIPGFGTGQAIQKTQALELIHQWANGLLSQKILGPYSRELGRSQVLLDAISQKGLGYFEKFQGNSKAREIFNQLYQLDTQDLQDITGVNSRETDLKIMARLKSKITPASETLSSSRTPALARAFSEPRFLKSSSAAIELARTAALTDIATETSSVAA